MKAPTVLLTAAIAFFALPVSCVTAKIAFVKAVPAHKGSRQAVSHIAAIDDSGANVHRITTGTHYDGAPSWSPDGRRIAFTRAAVRPEFTADQHLFVINADGSGLRQLTAGSVIDFHPSWSPDGRSIVFWHTINGGRLRGGVNSQLVTIDPDSGATRALTAPSGEDNSISAGPNWSPDGRSIVFAREQPGPDDSLVARVHLINTDGTNERAVTTALGLTTDEDPVWSPNGAQVAFIRNFNAKPDRIYRINPDGSGASALYTAGKRSPLPSLENLAWAPGGRIAVNAPISARAIDIVTGHRRRALLSAIFVLGANGRLKELTRPKYIAGDTQPAWSPLGT